MSDQNGNGHKEMMQVCGLWKNKDSKGRTYLSGNLNGAVRVLIFLNGYKSEEKQPDYRMYYVQNEKKDDAPAGDAGGDPLDQTPEAPAPEPTPEQKAAAAEAQTKEDNIPF